MRPFDNDDPIVLQSRIKELEKQIGHAQLKAEVLIMRRKRGMHSTNSFLWLGKYTNFIREYVPSRSNQLWVSDLVFWRFKERFLYISFITDAYSHKIVGFQLDKTLVAVSTIRALEMAIE